MKTNCPLTLTLTLTLTLPAAAAAQTTPPTELDTLRVVVASRATTLATATRSVEVIDAAAIRRAPARTVAEVLAWALGADVLGRSPAQADLALRGSAFEQVLVLVDGVRMNDAQTGHFHLNLAIPLDEIERIEVLRGAGSSIYGSDAMGGVIQIVTRGGGAGVEAGLEAGSFGMVGARAALGGSPGPVRTRVAAEAQRSDGHRPGTDASSLLVRGSLEASLAGGPLRADVGMALRDFGARHFYTSPRAPFDEYERTRAATASLGWRAPAAAGWSLAPRLSVRRHSDEFLLQRHDPGFYRNLHTSWQLGGELVARRAEAAGVAVSVGGEAYRDVLESTNLGDPSETRAALFGEVAVGREGAAVAHAGVRGDHHSAYGSFAAPSLAVAVWPAPALKLRASAGRSFRAPNWTERYYVDPANQGDPGLRPETAWNGEVAVEVAGPGGGAGVGLAAFVRDARDLIDWARPAADPDDTWRAMNVGRAVFRGVELDARATGPAGIRWTARAAFLGFATDDSEWDSKYALRPLTRTAFLGAARSILGADLSVRGRLARRVDEDSYLTVDTRVSRALGHGFRLDLDVTNLTGARYLDVTGLPAPGRAVYVGIAWR
jgi:outer membrane cobalamin receptor